jgi:UDP-glucose 4-epimerase
MKAIVFGGAGFLGSHVADALQDAGYDVTIFDINRSRHRRADQREIVGDILDEAAVGRAVAGNDVVYNFAGFADIEAAHREPLATIRLNILGNGIILEACRAAKVRRFVFASTVYVYSQAGSFYTASKQACEAYIENYRRMFGLDYTVLRYGSLYGGRADERNGMQRLLTQALRERRIVYWGDGEEVREYIHVDDAAQCSVQILGPAFVNEHVTIAGPTPMKVRDLLVMIREMLGNDVQVEYRPLDDSDPAGVHYRVTPYSFAPKIGRKLISTHYVDMGQGLLQCLETIHAQIGPGAQAIRLDA